REERVRVTLAAQCDERHTHRITRLVAYVRGKARKIFLTLVYSASPRFLEKLEMLCNGNFADHNLPVRRARRQIFSCNSSTNQSAWRCFDDQTTWPDADKDAFCRNQWTFLATKLEKRLFTYAVEKHRPLPFLPVPPDSSSS